MDHYCLKCGQDLADENFSSNEKARHVCKKCMAEEGAHRREHSDIVNQDIINYIEKEIIPRYAAFDKAHQESHVRMVIAQSLKLAEHIPTMKSDMVYVIAAFHDLGLVNGREHHHKVSRKILEADEFIRSRFTGKQIEIMGQAVEDHRASNQNKPRNDYGLIVAEADRFIDAETIIRRTIQYGLANYPELDYDGHYQRTLQHLNNKYGPNGYLKIWIPWSDNANNLKKLHVLLADRSKLNEIFQKIFNEEINPDQT